MTPADLLPILDMEPWLTMHLIADACEEQGETHLAAGWRWLARERMHPIRDRDGVWRWDGGRHGKPSDLASWRLPWKSLHVIEAVSSALGYPTCSQAIAAAAQAMATLHERGEDLEALR